MATFKDEVTLNGVGHMENDLEARFVDRTDLDDTNQGPDFRIPCGTTQMDELNKGPYNLNMMIRADTGTGVMGDARYVNNETFDQTNWVGDDAFSETEYTRARLVHKPGKSGSEPGREARQEQNTTGVQRDTGSHNRPIS